MEELQTADPATFQTDDVDLFLNRLEAAAKLFLELLRESKIFESQIYLPAIDCVCEVAKFIEEHGQIDGQITTFQEQSTQTFYRPPERDHFDEKDTREPTSTRRKSERTKFTSVKMLDFETVLKKKKMKSMSRNQETHQHPQGRIDDRSCTDLELKRNHRKDDHDLSSPNDSEQLCSSCGDPFEDVCSLEKHLQTAHEADLQDKHHVGGETTLLEQPKEHESEKENQRRKDHKRKSTLQQIQRPDEAGDGDRGKPSHKFHCQFCQRHFTMYRELKKHRLQQHKELLTSCDICGKKFKSSKNLKQHKVRICQSGKAHKLRGPVGIYKCDVCGLSYTGTARLNEHKLKHTSMEEKISGISQDNGLRFKCDICGRIYTSKCRLSKHLTHHDIEKDRKCDLCDKRFPFSRDLTIHSRAHSKGQDKLYTCHVCGVTSSSLNAFHYHIKTHQIDRPFVCTTCGKSFMRIHELQQHNRRHTGRPPLGTETFICEVCTKVYKTKSALQVHMKIHLGIYDHHCEFCQKKFKTLAELNHHRRVHTQEKPYKCDTCQRTFSRQSTLVNHRRTHTGECRSLCNECGMRFKNNNDLSKHIKRIHQNSGKDSATNDQVASNVAINTATVPPLPSLERDEADALAAASTSMPASAVIVAPQPPEPYVTFSLTDAEPSQVFISQELKPEVTALLQMDTPVLHQQQEALESQTIELWFE